MILTNELYIRSPARTHPATTAIRIVANGWDGTLRASVNWEMPNAPPVDEAGNGVRNDSVVRCEYTCPYKYIYMFGMTRPWNFDGR